MCSAIIRPATEPAELTLIADSGATKTTWLLCAGSHVIGRTATTGLNPVHTPTTSIIHTLATSVLPWLGGQKPRAVHFYGSGCRGEWGQRMAAALKQALGQEPDIHVGSDMLGAARALCGHSPGIACILGTGSNSCLYNGRDIANSLPPMGYVLGDEGSGAVLGRMFLNALYKRRLPGSLLAEMERATGLTLDTAIRRVYQEPQPSRFLASLAPFVHGHMACPGVEDLVISNFRSFFRHCVAPYHCPTLPIGIVGGLAAAFRPQLLQAAEMEQCHVGNIMANPAIALADYHAGQGQQPED